MSFKTLVQLLSSELPAVKGANPDEFLQRPWKDGWDEFVVGTVRGAYRASPDAFEILAIVNTQAGNGHFQKCIDWFERSCRREKLKLRFIEVVGDKLENYLIKNHFTKVSNDYEKEYL